MDLFKRAVILKLFKNIALATTCIVRVHARTDTHAHTDLSLQLFSKGVQVEIFQALWILQDLLQRSGRVGVLCRLIVLQGVHGHLASPLVRLGVDTGSVQNLDVGIGADSKKRIFFFKSACRNVQKSDCLQDTNSVAIYHTDS